MFDIGSNNKVVIKEPSLLLIEEFKAIWEKDKTKEKSTALKEFAYIFLKNDFKSSYRNGYSIEELPKVLKRDLSLPKNWKASESILKAEEKYVSLQTSKSLKLLMSAEQALEQVREYFDSFDITKIAEEKKAEAISKLMNNLKNIDEVVGKLEVAKRRVAEDLKSKTLSGKKVLTSRELPKNKR
jgi:hypothetical protein